MDAVYIVNVEDRGTFFRITDASGQKYATKDMWLASVCERAWKSKTPVRLLSSAGWFYRDLMNATLEPVAQGETA